MTPTPTVLEQLLEIVRRYPLERKLLICEGYAEGHQLLERLCRDYGPVLNLEVHTLRGLAADRIRLTLSKRGMTAVSGADTYWLTYGVLRDAAREQPGFLAEEQLTPGLIQAFHRTLQELREAGVQAEQLVEGDFENPAKGRLVRALLHGYERALQERKLADYAALVRMLPEGEGCRDIVVAEESVADSWADRLAFQRLSGGGGIILAAGLPFTDPDSGFPIPSARMFQANGALAEVREVFRRMLEKNLPWDHTELILSDYAGAITAVHMTAEHMGVACSYAEGLPIRCSKVGRGALQLLDWVDSDYHATHLIAAFREGLFTLREEEVSTSVAVKALEDSGIGWSRERYVLLKEADAWTTDESLRQACDAWGGFVEGCFRDIPSGKENTPGPAHILKAVANLLDKYSPYLSNPEERLVLTRIQEFHRSSGFLSAGAVNSLSGSIRLVRELIEALTFRAAGIPAEGAVYVSSPNSGGRSGRPCTFVVGMNEPVWRIRPKQDPVLLDKERLRISRELLASGTKSERSHKRKLERLGAIRGSCTLSYCDYDLAERREQYPAYELLQVYRLQTGRMAADYEELKEHLGASAGYSPMYGRSSIDEADIWMKRLVTAQGQIRDGMTFILGSYDHLRNGAEARSAREASLEWTVYDGQVDTRVHGIEFIPGDGSGKALSASRLELYARCPMQFFFQEVLRLRVKDAPVFDRTRWLDPMERGSLLHEIFEKYYAPWVENGGGAHNREWLRRITEETLEDYARRIPAPSPHVRKKESDSIRRDADIFFRQEQSRPCQPLYLELQLHQDEEPFGLEVSEELTLPLRGFVDRVDQVGPHEYRIVDYKTGKPAKYKEQEYFAGGTQLQHALYAMAVEQWLRKSGADPEARVVEAAYYFPTEKGLGEELVRLQNRKEELAELLSSILCSMRSGVFPPTREPSHCSYCDYAEVCGKHAVWMKDKSGHRLEQLREVYGHA